MPVFSRRSNKGRLAFETATDGRRRKEDCQRGGGVEKPEGGSGEEERGTGEWQANGSRGCCVRPWWAGGEDTEEKTKNKKDEEKAPFSK